MRRIDVERVRPLHVSPFVLWVLSTAPALAAPPAPQVVDFTPSTFVEMFVAGVVPADGGHTLVLVNAEEEVLLPVGIGLTEALSIHGRLERRPLARPMTHDLLDHIVEGLGGQVVRVQIDDVHDDVFVGSVFIRTGGRVVSFDARPSDAIALALGSRVPILVARPVVERAAIRPDSLPSDAQEPPSTSGAVAPRARVLLSL